MPEREAFTLRCLSAIATARADANESVQRIEASIVALAKEHGVEIPQAVN